MGEALILGDAALLPLSCRSRIKLDTPMIAPFLAVMACGDAIIPLQAHMALVADDADLEEVYNLTRRYLPPATHCSR